MNEERTFDGYTASNAVQQIDTIVGAGQGSDEASGATQTGYNQSDSGADQELQEQRKESVETKVEDDLRSQGFDLAIEHLLGDDLLAFNALTLKAKFPKSYKKVVDFMQVKSSLDTDEDTILGVFLYSPKTVVYNFFDDNELYINVGGWKQDWHYTINGSPAEFCSSRTFAEHGAVLKAFELLEATL